MSNRWQIFKKLAFAGSAVLAVLIFLEGLCGVLTVGYDLALHSVPVLAERVHTQYDADLGWVNIASLRVDDMYGPGLYLKTNARGFRNDAEFDVSVPPDKVRAICSGDSFTLGYGVANDQTLPHYLAQQHPRLETVNMGQGGYGVDQAYLWYMRDGRVLDHDLHVFLFVPDDFIRMRFDNYRGYGKPVLKVAQGKLQVANVPVPRSGYRLPWLTHNAGLFRQLNTVALAGRLAKPLARKKNAAIELTNQQVLATAGEVFEALRRTNQQKKSVLVLVCLPMLTDYAELVSDSLRQYLNRLTIERKLPYFDLINDYRQLPQAAAARLFIDPTDITSHYSAAGNRFFAEVLFKKLMTVPEIKQRLLAGDHP